jgi:lysophospholipase L1-like esterase
VCGIAVGQEPSLEFWPQSFDRNAEALQVSKIHDADLFKKFRGLYFKSAASGMDMRSIDRRLAAAFDQFNAAPGPGITKLAAKLGPLAAEMLAYQPPPIREEAFVYVAMGASISLGAGASPASQGWVYRVADRLADRQPDFQFRNIAGGGETAYDARREQVEEAIALKPDLITYTAGLNDLQYGKSIRSIRRNTEKVLKALRENTNATIVMSRMTYHDRAPALHAKIKKLENRRKHLSKKRIDAFNAAYSELAQRYGVTLVDLGAIIEPGMRDADIDSLWSYDATHPNNAGHAKIEAIFWEGIKAAYTKKL